MPFNARAMAHITKQHRTDMLTYWQKLIKNIEWAAYHGYDYYILDPHEWQYIDKLREYGFEIVYNDGVLRHGFLAEIQDGTDRR